MCSLYLLEVVVNQPQDIEKTKRMSEHHDSRLAKLAKIEALGVDPWGHHFPNRNWNSDARALSTEIKFRLADGRQLDLPEFPEANTTNADAAIDYRAWKQQAGEGEEVGPTVRVAGRIILQRGQGKLKFITLRDWTGDIQILIGKAQVGDTAFELSGEFDLGDWIAVEGRLGRTNTGEVTVFAASLHFMCKTLEPPPEKFAGLQDADQKQRQRYLDLTYNE